MRSRSSACKHPAAERDFFRPPLLEQPFFAQGLLDRRTGSDALLECLQMRPWRQVELDPARPVCHGKQIGIGHAETVAEQVIMTVQQLIEIGVALRQVGSPVLLDGVGQVGPEQRGIILVDFDRDVVEQRGQLIAFEAAGRGCELARLAGSNAIL